MLSIITPLGLRCVLRFPFISGVYMYSILVGILVFRSPFAHLFFHLLVHLFLSCFNVCSHNLIILYLPLFLHGPCIQYIIADTHLFSHVQHLLSQRYSLYYALPVPPQRITNWTKRHTRAPVTRDADRIYWAPFPVPRCHRIFRLDLLFDHHQSSSPPSSTSLTPNIT